MFWWKATGANKQDLKNTMTAVARYSCARLAAVKEEPSPG